MASTVHQTQDQERNSPSRRAGSLPARSLASELCRLERPIRSPSIESSLLHQIPSCFSAGPRIYTGLLVLPEHRCCIYPSPLFTSPGQGILDEPPNVMPDVRIPEREERRLPRQCNLHKWEVFIAGSSQGSRRASNTVVRSQRALGPSCCPIYKVCISSW